VNRRKLIGVLASVLVAGVGTMILLKSVNSGGTTAAPVAEEPMVNVLKVVKPVPKGTPADLLGDAVTVQQIRASEKLNDTADNVAQIAGLVANTDLVPNEQIVISRFVQKDVQKKEDELATGGAGLIGVWVSLDPLRAVAAQNGKLGIGDQVAVFANITGVDSVQPNPGEPVQTNPSTSLILHKVPVLDCLGCFDPTTVVVPPGGAAPVPPAPGTPVQVKLGVDAPAAERLVFAARYGEILVSDEASDVLEENTKVVDRSNIFERTDAQRPKQATLESSTAGSAAPRTTATAGAATATTAKPAAAPAATAPRAAAPTTPNPAAVTAAAPATAAPAGAAAPLTPAAVPAS
jgi:pilus assembly protein CpaB